MCICVWMQLAVPWCGENYVDCTFSDKTLKSFPFINNRWHSAQRRNLRPRPYERSYCCNGMILLRNSPAEQYQRQHQTTDLTGKTKAHIVWTVLEGIRLQYLGKESYRAWIPRPSDPINYYCQKSLSCSERIKIWRILFEETKIV